MHSSTQARRDCPHSTWFPAGTYDPHVADGYFLVLTPLSAGEHTIVVHVVNLTSNLDYTATYHITVSPHSGGKD
jgi:hypothetical protein